MLWCTGGHQCVRTSKQIESPSLGDDLLAGVHAN